MIEFIYFAAGVLFGTVIAWFAISLATSSAESDKAADRDYLEYLIDKLEDASDES